MKDYLYFLMEELWTELSGDEWSCRPLLALEMEMQLEKMEEREMEGNREKKEKKENNSLAQWKPWSRLFHLRFALTSLLEKILNLKQKLKGKVISEEEKEEIWR